MQSNPKGVKSHLKLLLDLVEMRDLESFIISVTTNASERADLPQAREILIRWAQESQDHMNILQSAISKLQDKTQNDDYKVILDGYIDKPYCISQILRFLQLDMKSLGVKEVYTLFKQHLTLEYNAGAKYAEMAQMTDDLEMREMLQKLSMCEKVHHSEAEHLLKSLKTEYSGIIGDNDV